MSYTKGPWRARTKVLKYHMRTDIQAKLGDTWKTLFIGNYYANEEDNAVLIAAAPAMLEALEKAAKSEHHPHCGLRKKSMSCSCHVWPCMEAIRQAKGGQS